MRLATYRLGLLRVATAAAAAVVILSRHCNRGIELLLMMRLKCTAMRESDSMS